MTRKVGASVSVTSSSLNHPKCRLLEAINDHCFSHQLEVLVPSDQDLSYPDESAFHTIAAGGFCAIHCKLETFLQEDILELIALPNATFRAIGVSSSFDREDSIAVTAAGQLHLRLSQTAYQKLGLAGTQSEEISGQYHVVVDLNSKTFRSKGHYYKQVLKCLQALPGEFDFLCLTAKELQSETISFSKVLSNTYRADSKGTSFPRLERLCRPHKADSLAGLDQQELLYALEALGALSLDVQPDACADLLQGSVQKHTWTGLVSPSQVEACLQVALQCLEAKECAWVALTVRGFKHAPVVWEVKQEGRIESKDKGHDYIILLLSDKQYIRFVMDDAGSGFVISPSS